MCDIPIADACAAVRLSLRGAGDHGRVGRLAVLPAVRQPVGVRPAAGRRQPGTGRSRPPGDLDRHPPLSGPDDGAGDNLHAPPTGRLVAHRCAGDGRGNARPRPGPRRSAPADAAASAAFRARSRSDLEYVPRPEYGLVWPLLAEVDGGVTAPRRGRVAGAVHAGTAASCDGVARRGAGSPMAAGEVLSSVCTASDAGAAPGPVCGPRHELAGRLDDTVAAWRSWSASAPELRGAVARPGAHSGRVLQALTYQPERRHGRGADHLAAGGRRAASATGTTATPGSATRSFTMDALWVAACPDEAEQVLRLPGHRGRERRWARATDLQIMFGVGGEHDLSERELPHLARLARQPPGPGGQRGLEPAPDRRLRRAARRGAAAGRPDSASIGRRHGAVPDRAGRHRGRRWTREGPGHLGGPRRTRSTSCTRR